jgi:hypothetical protein
MLTYLRMTMLATAGQQVSLCHEIARATWSDTIGQFIHFLMVLR